MSIIVVRFDLSPVLMLCLFDGSSEGRGGFLKASGLESRSLKAAAPRFCLVQMLPVIHGFWMQFLHRVVAKSFENDTNINFHKVCCFSVFRYFCQMLLWNTEV